MVGNFSLVLYTISLTAREGWEEKTSPRFQVLLELSPGSLNILKGDKPCWSLTSFSSYLRRPKERSVPEGPSWASPRLVLNARSKVSAAMWPCCPCLAHLARCTGTTPASLLAAFRGSCTVAVLGCISSWGVCSGWKQGHREGRSIAWPPYPRGSSDPVGRCYLSPSRGRMQGR